MSLAKWIGAVSGAGADITVTPATLAAEATLHAPTVVIDCTVTPATLAAEATLHAPTIVVDCTVTPAALSGIATLQTPVTVHIDWLGIDSSHLDSYCHLGDYGNLLTDALDGNSYWEHEISEVHWFVLDLGVTHYITKVQGRSNTIADPIDVDIYVSDDKENWGAAVATGISVFQDTVSWVEAAITAKNGRYIKIVIVATEHGTPGRVLWGQSTPFTIFDIYTVVIDCTVTPATLAAEATLHAPTIVVDCTVTPAALAAEATLHAPTIVVDCTVTPAALSGIATLQTPVTVSIQYPGSFSALATLHAPAICFDCTVTPATLAAAATLQTPLTALDITVTPAALTALAALLTPGVSVFYTDIPPFILEDLIDPYSGGAWLWLIEVVVPGYDTVRLARNTEDVLYGLDNFPKSSFAVNKQVLSGDGTIPRIALRIAQDEAHNLEAIMNASHGMENGSVKVIRTCEKFLETPVQDFEALYGILTAGSDSEWLALSLGIPNPLTQKIPRDLYSSSICPLATPSLFKGVKCRYSGEDTTCTGLFEDCRTKGNAQHWGAELGLDPSSIRV